MQKSDGLVAIDLFARFRGFVVLLFLAFADLSTKLLHISFSLMISLPLPWHISYFLIITEDAKQEVDSDSSTCVFQSRVWWLVKSKIPGFYEIKICFLPMLRYFLFRKSRESSSNHKEIPDSLLLRNNLFRENEHNLECIYHATCSSSEQDIWICCRFIIFWDMCRLKSQRVGEYAEKFALKDWASERILCLKLFIKTIRG